MKDVLAERPLPGAPLEQRVAYDPWEAIAVSWDARKVRGLFLGTLRMSCGTLGVRVWEARRWQAHSWEQKGEVYTLLSSYVRVYCHKSSTQ